MLMAKAGLEMEEVKQIETEKIWTKDFILIFSAKFFIFLGFQMTLPTIPLFVEHLGGNDRLIGLTVGIFTVSALLVRPFAGRALETIGRKAVYLTGLFLFALTVGSYSFITGIFLLLLFRIFQGAGWGMSTTASGTIATDLIPAKRRGEGLGYYGLAGNLAMAFGPSLGLILVPLVTFRWLFIICAFLGFIALVLSMFIQYKKVDRNSDPSPKKLDIFEKSAIQPSLLMFFITVTFGGIATFLPLYTLEKGVDGIQLYFLIYAVALMITRAFAGKLYDRKGHKAVFLPGAALIFTAMLLLAWIPNHCVLFTAAFLNGFGFGLIQPGLQSWAIVRSPVNRRGMVNATFFSFFDLGIGLGAIAFGQIGHWLG